MAPRPYRMSKRSESADETRRRIVQATYELHAEKGVAATSVRDIAERADVSVGTVYHHFPTYDEVIQACGELTLALTRPPGVEVLDGIAAPAARLRALVEALFGFYFRCPGFERVRADRDRFKPLEAFLAKEEQTRRELIAAALAPRRPSRRAAALAFAMLDVAVYRALLASGLAHAEAIEEAAAALERWLIDSPQPRSKSKEPR